MPVLMVSALYSGVMQRMGSELRERLRVVVAELVDIPGWWRSWLTFRGRAVG